MAVTFTDEQQEFFNNTLAEEKRKQAKKYEGYTSPDDLAGFKAGYEKQIADLTAALDSASKKVANHEKEIAERDSKIKGYEIGAMRSRIAHESGLSYDAIGFLTGDDEDGIRASAGKLKELIGSGHMQAQAPSSEPSVKNVSNASLLKIAQSVGKN